MNESVKQIRYASNSFLVKAGFVLGLGLLVLVVVPNFIKARSVPCANACISNLRQIDAAANQFALEQSKTNGEAIHYPEDLTPYIKLNSAGKISGCPGGGFYNLWRVGQIPKCSLGITNFGHVLP